MKLNANDISTLYEEHADAILKFTHSFRDAERALLRHTH